MSDRTCPECGETKPRSKFLNQIRHVVPVCTSCRRRAQQRDYARRKRAQKRGLRQVQEQTLRTQEHTRNLKKFLSNDEGHQVCKDIERLIRAEWRKLQKYEERYATRDYSDRLDKAMRDRHQKKRFLNEALAIAVEDTKRGECKPVVWYIENTYLLNKHGFYCAIDESHENICKDNVTGCDFVPLGD